ncbi:MAG TPA: MFS transporter [Jatrophihabitans sp.]|jgi:MFS family permease
MKTRRRSVLYGTLVAHAVSVSGTRVSAIALPWFVLTSTGSATKTGLVATFELLPLVVVKALGGPIIDRIGPRRISITADLASAFVVGLIPLLHVLNALDFPGLLGLVAIAGALRGPGDTAKETMIPEIAGVSGVPLERVTGLGGSTDRGAMIVGPAIAGLLISAIGPVNAIVVDAASFAICAAIMAVYAPRRHERTEPDEAGYLRQLHSGWDFLIREPLMRSLCVMIAVTNLLDAAYSGVLVPVWVRDHGHGAAAIGLVGSAFGITATVASLLAAAYGERLPRRLTYLVGFFVAGVPRYVALAFGAPLWLVIGISAMGGFGAGFINPILGAIYLERVPRPLLGRVMALGDSLAWIGMPFGGILAGLALSGVDLAPALLIAGGGYLIATAVPGLLPQWRDMDRRVEPGSRASGAQAGMDPSEGALAEPAASRSA